MKLLSISGDMEEANDMAGVTSATSRTGCRFCYMPHCDYDEGQFCQPEWRKEVMLRQMHIDDRVRNQALRETNINGKMNVELLKEAGVVPILPLISSHGPAFDRCTQVLHPVPSIDTVANMVT